MTTCPLCVTLIRERCYAHGDRAWMARCQVVKLGRGSWHLPANSRVYERRGMMATHTACWSIIKAVFGPDRDYEDDAWMGRFANTLRDLEPWMREAEADGAPQLCDTYNFEDRIPVNEGNAPGCFDRFALPTEVVQLIYDSLSDSKDVMNLMEASMFTPSAAQLLSLGRKYLIANDSPIRGSTNSETVDRTRWLLWNLQFRPKSLPSTMNYKTVWDNVELVDEKLRQALQGKTPDPSELAPRRYTAHATMPAGTPIEKSIRVGTGVSKVSFFFSPVGDELYLCGIGFDSQSVGYESDYAIRASVCQLRGLILASDGVGFTSVKVKDGDSFKRGWLRALSHAYVEPGKVKRISGLTRVPPTFAHFEWPSDREFSVHLSLDTFKIQRFSSTPEVAEFQSWPVTWAFKYPPSTLTPSPLVDLAVLADGLIFGYVVDLENVTGVAALIDQNMRIQRFEFTSHGKLISTLGCVFSPDSPTWSKLSFRLDSDRGEVINGLACAFDEDVICPTLSVKFLTTCGRAIHFGIPRSKWSTTWCPNGIFGSCRVSLNSDRYSPSSLAVFGALRDPSEPEIAPPEVSAYQEVNLRQKSAPQLNDAVHAAL